jgi:formylmethanofuran dehydrogenase subunit E
MRGYLKWMVLRLLSSRDMSGYDLMKELGVGLGSKPSPGSMYPLLESMMNDELATVKVDGRKKVYKITVKGKVEFKDMVKQKEKICSNMSSIMNELFPDDSGEQFMKNFHDEVMQMHKLPDMMEMNKAIISLVKDGRFDKNKGALSQIFKDATKKVESLR